MKILIIDDEPLVRRSLGRAFKSRGHDVSEAEDGLHGLEAWKSGKPDLVFLDVLMPGMTGPQVLREIGKARTGKVILISAFSGEHNMQTATEMGADLFLPKPFEDIFAVVTLAEDFLK
ncbi:MAG: response regulator [Bdellovibrionaceae bacterium]|nr:response regulator [Pseudobdellovibrionaceae bacterium]